jgi:predicted transcriptional regulator
VQGKKRAFKRRSPQHNKPTHPNNEVPLQDAQLQGVVSVASIHNYKPKQEVPPKDAKLQGVIKDEKQDPIKEPPWASAQLQSKLVNHPQELNKIACEIT